MWLEDAQAGEGAARLFARPKAILTARRAEEVSALFARLGEGLASGLWAAGYLAYELGYLFEPRLSSLMRSSAWPLAWLGLFDAPRSLSGAEARGLLAGAAPQEARLALPVPMPTREAYLAGVRRIIGLLHAGDAYQVNLTFPCMTRVEGSPFALYRRLREADVPRHGGFLATEEGAILSLSPELFLARKGAALITRPMKGTAPRGVGAEADAALATGLTRDAKSRAENLMIVDLLRNDLGRIAEIGSVDVPELFTLETYPTLHQMTSTVTARLRPGTSLPDLLRAVFPCGSVTGAPKIRAMEIITELEQGPRGVYTGSLGWIAPNGDAQFNVAIRTLSVAPDGRATFPVGSGIVADSDPEAEYEECLLKARCLDPAMEAFRLLETLRWERGRGYWLQNRHLERLERSARALGFRFARSAIEAALGEAAQHFGGAGQRVRLLLARDGAPEIEVAPLPATPRLWRYRIARTRVSSTDPLLRHKTTARALYEAGEAEAREQGIDEVLFLNERGELTEGTKTTIFAEIGGVLVTPPLASGLLPGTLRAALVEGEVPYPAPVRERVLSPADLAGAKAVYLGNALRGLIRAEAV